MEFVPPILHREFVVRSRDRATYLFRFVTASVSFLMAFGFVVLPSLLGSGLSQNGGLGFSVCSWILWLFCWIEGIRVSSDCLSGEKRDGTIGLLFLTRMGGFDIVVGKLSSGLVGSLFALLAALPILAFLMLSGGVTGGEFFRICLSLVVTLVFALSLGVLISARSFHAGRSLLGSGGLLLVWILVSLIASSRFNGFVPSPWSLLAGSFDVEYQLNSSRYWISLVTVGLFALFCVVASGFVLRRHWQIGPDSEGPRKTQERSRLKQWLGLSFRMPLSDRHPIAWLAERARWIKNEKRFAGVVLLIGIPLAILPPVASGFSTVIGWVLIGGLMWEGLRFFMGARSSGYLELILTTPIAVNEMLFELHLHARRFAFYGVALVFALGLLGFFGGTLFGIFWSSSGVLAGTGMFGSAAAFATGSDWAIQLGLKLLTLGFGALTGYFWFYGVYWYSLWRGAIGSSIANGLGWILFVSLIAFAFYIWIGTLLFMLPFIVGGRVMGSSPFLIVMFTSGGSTILTCLYFGRLARQSKRKLRVFLSPSSPFVHGMKRHPIPSFR